MFHKVEVNGYVNDEIVAECLIGLALKENKLLSDVKNELRERYPGIRFVKEDMYTFPGPLPKIPEEIIKRTRKSEAEILEEFWKSHRR